MNKVSIIVPIYNAEKFINKCIDSIIGQTYKNLEIILINDGSKDGTKDIIETYDDERIVFIDKENTGVGNTRNLGIEKSSGDYIMFVDSDDFIEHNCVEKLLDKAVRDDCDLVICNYYLDTSESIEIRFPLFEDASLKENPDIITKINLGPCNKIYRSTLFKGTDNRFIENLKYEDAPVVIQALRDANKIGIIDDFLCHYVIQKSGETMTRNEKVFDIIEICKIIMNKLENHDYIDKTSLIVKILMYYLKNAKYIDDVELRDRFVNDVYNYLRSIDKNWRKASYLKRESKLKRMVLQNEILLKLSYKLR